MNRRIIAILLAVAAVIGVGTSAAALSGVLTITPGAESLQLVDYTIANVTIKNVGSNSVTLVKVDVERAPFNGYTPNPSVETIYFKSPIVIGSGQGSTISESFTGSGSNITAHFVSERGHIFTWFLAYRLPQPHPVVLIIIGGGFADTGVGMLFYASSSAPFTLRSYTFIDANGNNWENASWRIPISGSSSFSEYMPIGPGSGATYTGGVGAFDKFTTGNQYTIVIGTSTNEQFFFSLTR